MLLLLENKRDFDGKIPAYEIPINFSMSLSAPIFPSLETARYYTEQKRYNHTTPSSYLEMTQLYADILKTKQEEIVCHERRHTKGLEKLRDIADIVAALEVSHYVTGVLCHRNCHLSSLSYQCEINIMIFLFTSSRI